MRWSFQRGLKSELIVKFITVVAITTLVSCFMGTLLINRWVKGQGEGAVRNALTSAQGILDHRLENIRNIVRFASSQDRFRQAFLSRDRIRLGRYLANMANEGSLDIVDVVDAKGVVVLRKSNPGLFDDSLSDDAVVSRALSSGKNASSVEALPYETVKREGKELASRCAMDPAASGPRAMVLMAASPILLEDGKTVGALLAGEVLNRNDAIVDGIMDVLYRNETYRGRDLGIASMFLGDTRIATNFRKADGTRSFGTRASKEVCRAVLGEGRQWIGTVPVVDEEYLAAYEPIRDMKHLVIGMIAVGMLEQRFADMRTGTLTMFLGISLFGMALSIVAAAFFADSIVKPVNALVRASHRIAQGDFSVRVEAFSEKEIGELEKTFNLMASSLEARDREIERLNVQRLERSEKLASIGRLAAGVAHEINNPLTSVLTFGSLLLKKAGEEQKEKLEIIVKETTRCREIVKGLLNFARQGKPKKESCNINKIIEDALSIAGNQLKIKENRIRVEKDLGEVPPLCVDPNQMSEVFVNLIINAVDALPMDGEIKICTKLSGDEKSVEVGVQDTGCGIPEENLEKVFDPFFTTKEPRKGTGLGLSVAYGIVDGHNGTIDVRSEVGKGTTFLISLPVK